MDGDRQGWFVAVLRLVSQQLDDLVSKVCNNIPFVHSRNIWPIPLIMPGLAIPAPAPEADKHDYLTPPGHPSLHLDTQVSTSDQHGDFKSKEREPVSTLDSPRGMADG